MPLLTDVSGDRLIGKRELLARAAVQCGGHRSPKELGALRRALVPGACYRAGRRARRCGLRWQGHRSTTDKRRWNYDFLKLNVIVPTTFTGTPESIVGENFASFAACLTAFAIAREPYGGFVAGFLLGFAYFGTTTSMLTVMQSRLADHERGRVMSLWFMAFGGTVPLGNLGQAALLLIFAYGGYEVTGIPAGALLAVTAGGTMIDLGSGSWRFTGSQAEANALAFAAGYAGGDHTIGMSVVTIDGASRGTPALSRSSWRSEYRTRSSQAPLQASRRHCVAVRSGRVSRIGLPNAS